MDIAISVARIEKEIERHGYHFPSGIDKIPFFVQAADDLRKKQTRTGKPGSSSMPIETEKISSITGDIVYLDNRPDSEVAAEIIEMLKAI